ncbi:MAG TPA: argininosuccinate lyase [Candidatus Hydrogenedentes bacterium]|nr:argininosuccinate lyase [Candidatus Hydrogenedentota bacterium]HOL77601.1 argininosuccinate lyase [Candidatus Hydrogenedentota bacterium]HPO86726.1 argininosuccinate lyase [Candidatus Hydrogenedentota bacterium]
MSKQWGGRFEKPVDKMVEMFTQSVSFDSRLAPYDIAASIAHAEMLGKQKIISRRDAAAIVKGLREILREIDAGKFRWDVSLEDVHTNIEAALVARIGEAGRRLHTARSRNDQVATDVRLWARDQVDCIIEKVRLLQHTLVRIAEQHVSTLLPGFTHLQHAQPVSLAHHLLAYFEMLQRDRQRFTEVRNRLNVLPLGSAALAGTPHPIDRLFVAKKLGFDRISENSMDAVSDRDFLIEICSCSALLMMHLSRFCEELIVWSSPEFGFVEIGDEFTTGSSIMPQKKNPDVAELIRGKTGRVYGSLMALLTVMKGLPLAYNRDMQEDKERAFDVVDTVENCLDVMTGMLANTRFCSDRMHAAAEQGFLEATDVADYLVAKGVAFREAHALVGRIVLFCVKNQKRLTELTLDEYRTFSPCFDDDVFPLLRLESVVNRRNTPGATGMRQVRRALQKAKKALE